MALCFVPIRLGAGVETVPRSTPSSMRASVDEISQQVLDVRRGDGRGVRHEVFRRPFHRCRAARRYRLLGRCVSAFEREDCPRVAQRSLVVEDRSVNRRRPITPDHLDFLVTQITEDAEAPRNVTSRAQMMLDTIKASGKAP